MRAAYFITGGGVFFCESKEYIEFYIKPDHRSADLARMGEINRQYPMHTVIGNSGYTKGVGKWPKEGHYCDACGAFIIRAKH